jgi:hypothetical protein
MLLTQENFMEMNTSAAGPATTVEVRCATVLNVLLGIWVIVSPFVLHIKCPSAVMWNNIAVGIAVLLLVLFGNLKQGVIQALIIPVATWLFASSVILDFSGLAFLWSNVLSTFAMVAATAFIGALRPTQ